MTSIDDTSSELTVSEIANAKLNLTLHVTGQRDDGYHELDSLVMFTSLGDEITARAANDLSLTINGPFAADLDTGPENLVLRAARLMGASKGAAITLTKNLPVASGIGGGSADAAATLRALSRLWGVPLPTPDQLLSLGADVPVCMSRELAQMRGIGEDLTRLGPAPMLDLVLVNPGVSLPTPEVFSALTNKQNPAPPAGMPDPFDIEDWTAWIAAQRNDLEKPACAIAPVIGDVLTALRAQDGCEMARMSGSGATCFGIFTDADTRDAAVSALKHGHPDWWIAATDEAPL